MLVRVRSGMNLKLGEKVYPEGTYMDLSEFQFKSFSTSLERVIPSNRREQLYYDDKKATMSESKPFFREDPVTVKIRKGYGYIDPRTNRQYKEGDTVTITDRVFTMREWIFEPIVTEKKAVEEKVVNPDEIKDRRDRMIHNKQQKRQVEV